MSANSYRDAASRNFEALRKLYSTNDNLDCKDAAAVSFWRLGNGLDTMIDYFDANSNVRTFMTQPDYQNMLRDSANKVASLPTDRVPFVELTNRLAVLVAATAILK